MSNDVVIRSGSTTKIGDRDAEIRDADARTVFVDFFSENRLNNSTVCLSLGALHVDGANEPVIDISTRLRMDLGFAQILHGVLGEIIAMALKPVDQKPN
ncbi:MULTISPECIES: hypothetical protein [Rhizobium]|uniref:hypothetical protein n=1 Tax=Rhizobium TaxID=379 RepID=UPI00103114EA|nr:MULTISPECIES: hypothetical protein [Rhizobium]MBY3369391.1 hypothetical protein [Rhizobium laguerreae]MBY3491154.1 hypothetical protein [Rhizobium laguerreae]MBY5399758.1 hypothetical protein [Rhizobium leguminosarum]TAX92031.1 hypothetical protein ELH97_08865 [Rhizobium leguminosarum]